MNSAEFNEDEDREKAFAAVGVITKTLNIMGDDQRVKFFIESMHNEHRTLQQGFTRLVLAWLKHLSTLPEGHYDLRNKASVEIAKKLVGKLDKFDLHLPTV